MNILNIKPGTPKGYLLKYNQLGDILLHRKLLDKSQLEQALAYQQNNGGRLGDILIEMNFIDENELTKALGEQLSIPFITAESKVDVSKDAPSLISETLAQQYMVFPLVKKNNTLILAMVDPFDVPTMDAVKNLTGLEIDPVIITKSELQRLIRKYYQEESEKQALHSILSNAVSAIHLEVNLGSEDQIDVDKLRKEIESAPVVKLVDFMIWNALNERASDIHIEPEENQQVIRYRIDGVLHVIANSPRNLHMAVVSRIKILSGLNIAERRLPQDGRFTLKFGSRQVDLRVSTLPTMFGEKVVLRLLEKGSMSYRLEDLGFDEGSLKLFRKHIHNPYGMVLLTGPTGSGKTTTLYSALMEMKSSEVNVVTVEDPVEYQLPGVYQMQVNSQIDLTFATGLRSILRQDPDIIMVGEIRDRETADMGIRSALTGHLVLSTLHTNDAVSSISRLVDMGVEAYLICSVLSLVVAQRLVRRLCPSCKASYTPSRDELESLGVEVNNGVGLYRGKGCDKCRHTGFYGRLAIVEMLELNEDVRRLILKGESGDVIKRYAIENGMQTLRQNGIQHKVLQGLTTIQELMSVCLEY